MTIQSNEPGAIEKIFRILIVDDDEVDRMAISRALIRTGLQLEVSEAENSVIAIANLENSDFDCAFIDYCLPGKDGLALIQELRDNGVNIPIIVLTGQGDERIAVDLMKAGASDYLSKSEISGPMLIQSLQNALTLPPVA